MEIGMLAVRKYLLAGVASLGLLMAGATSGQAGPLELNPTAPNGSNGPLDTTCTGTCGGNYPFFTNNSSIFYTSDLHVQGLPGTPGTQAAQETGSILIAN